MNTYYVFYDGACPFCRRIKDWLEAQPQRYPLRLVAREDPAVNRDFPGVREWFQWDQVVVVSSAGELWVGGPAWLTVLYALEDYWEWAFRLAAPELQDTAFKVIYQLSLRRAWISRLMKYDDEDEAAEARPGGCAGTCAREG